MFSHLILACSLLSLMPSDDCHNIEVLYRRSFDDRSPITLDVDGDGMPDALSPRTYTVKTGRKAPAGGRLRGREAHWISFDLKTSKGRVLNSFFRYKYGTEESDYWVYAVMPCDANKDGRVDLVFYAGDDTSDETVIIINDGKRFRVHSRRTSVVE